MSVPAKVFLIGEHSVVQGGSSLLLALKPPFIYQKKIQAEDFHPDSPVGAYLKDSAQHLSFAISSLGLGPGFGSSTAELIACVSLLHGKLPEAGPIWDWYQKRFSHASGADFAAQLSTLHTGLPLTEVSRKTLHPLGRIGSIADQILLFKAPAHEKKNTHDVLTARDSNQAASLDLKTLDRWVDQAKTAFLENDLSLLSAFRDFAEYLSARGFESSFAKKVRTKLSAQSGVLAVKGCGAQMNDVFLVVMNQLRPSPLALLDAAKEQGLSFLGSLGECQW